MRGSAIFMVALSAICLTTGCTAEQPFPPCPDGASRAEVFNTYADHPIADLHVLEGSRVSLVCDYALAYERAEPRSFKEDELGKRRITIFRIFGKDSTSTVWAYGLPGADVATALIFDTGESFFLPNSGPDEYLAAESTVIDRSEIPTR